jgi:hypothetical protein
VRVRTLVDRIVWTAAVAFLAYAAVLAGASYFETRQLVDEAVFEASRRPRAVGQDSLSTQQELAAYTREAILVAARRGSVPLESSQLTVTPAGDGLRVSLHWSYVLLTVAGETVVAIPLWLDQTFDVNP